MKQEFDELYAEYYLDDDTMLQSRNEVKLEPTPETIEYLTFVYEDMGRGSYLHHFEQSQDNFVLPLKSWVAWFDETAQNSVDIHSIHAYLQEEKGTTSPSEAILTFELMNKKQNQTVIFIGRKVFETLMREYQSIELIHPEDKLVYSVQGVSHLSASMIENVLLEFAMMNLSEQTAQMIERGNGNLMFTDIESWNDFTPEAISEEPSENAHFIMWYK